MIPRIIHYIWLSGEAYPPEVESCIQSWHKWMPDWQFMLWDMDRIKDLDIPWLNETIAERKWAFASDFIRVYAVSQYGGIYLDCDCRILKSMDSFLMNQAFIGKEWTVHEVGFATEQYLTSHCFGAVAHHPFIQRCVDYYMHRHFLLSEDQSLPDTLRFDQTLMPKVQCELAKALGYNPSPYCREQQLQEGLHIYPSQYFDTYRLSEYTHCVHLCLGSWRTVNRQSPTKVTLGLRIRYHIDDWLIRFMDKCGYVIFRKK